MSKTIWLSFLALNCVMFPSIAFGDESVRIRKLSQQNHHGIYFDMHSLSEEEQVAFRNRIRNAKKTEDIDAIREERKQLMMIRSKEKVSVISTSRLVAGDGIKNIFGPQLITEGEKAVYRARIRSAQSQEEIDKIHGEYHAEMERRSNNNGVIQPELRSVHIKEN